LRLRLALATTNDVQAGDKSAVSPSRLHLPNGPGSLEDIGENVQPNLSMALGIGCGVAAARIGTFAISAHD
jgi:hypothetical protein